MAKKAKKTNTAKKASAAKRPRKVKQAAKKAQPAKTYLRRFRKPWVNLDLFSRCAEEVIDEIENETILVYAPGDCIVEQCTGRDAEGREFIDPDTATVPANVKEWLPVVCQFIRWEQGILGTLDDEHDSNTCAWYASNANRVMWPPEDTDAMDVAGPAALVAGIVLRREKLIDNAVMTNPKWTKQWHRLKCVIAHELVHAFYAMRFIVPAFTNWRKFWKESLHEGSIADSLLWNHFDSQLGLDDYGGENELAEILRFWPSQGRQWFEAMRIPKKRRSTKK